MKVVFGKAGPVQLEEAVEALDRASGAQTFFTSKLWSYFIPVPADDETPAALEALYVHSGYPIRRC